jgi:hypothetical protein
VATVYRRGSAWWVRFRWRGVEVRRSARTSSKAVAQRTLARLLDEHRRLDRDRRPRRTYREALERFSAEYTAALKPATQRRYRTSFRQLAAAFGGLHLDEIPIPCFRGRPALPEAPGHVGRAARRRQSGERF